MNGAAQHHAAAGGRRLLQVLSDTGQSQTPPAAERERSATRVIVRRQPLRSSSVSFGFGRARSSEASRSVTALW